MSDTYEIENNAIDGEDEMGSLHHSNMQTKLNVLLFQEERFFVATELSLDISQHDLSKYKLDAKDELRPDVCAYLEPPVVPDGTDDLVKVSQMPDLAIEILSPRQSVGYLIRKIKAFFALGVKSCWLVMPSLETIRVFSQPQRFKNFDVNDTEVIDEVMDIRFPIQKLFDYPSNKISVTVGDKSPTTNR
jgi:Uma2 family endonuclease